MRVLITRPRSEAAEFGRALAEIGAEAVFFPTISIGPLKDTSVLDQALSNLQDYDWLVLTSANAAGVVLDRKAALGIDNFPDSLRIAAIGPRTASRLLEGAVSAHFIPDDHIAEAILPGLGDLVDRRVLLPTADIARGTLPRAIQEAGGVAHVVTAYHTLPAEPDPEGLAAILKGLDIITFTSGSTAQDFVLLIERARLDPFGLPGHPIIACIGPKTAQVARDLGFSVDIVANEHTVEGLVRAISSYLQKAPPHDAI